MPRPAQRRSIWLNAICCVAGGILASGSVHAADPEPKVTERQAPNPFLVIEDIRVPIVDSGSIEGVLNVSFVIKAQSPESAQTLASRMPEIRAVALAHTIEFARLYASPYTPVDASRLSEMVNAPIKKLDRRVAQVLIVRVSATTN